MPLIHFQMVSLEVNSSLLSSFQFFSNKKKVISIQNWFIQSDQLSASPGPRLEIGVTGY